MSTLLTLPPPSSTTRPLPRTEGLTDDAAAAMIRLYRDLGVSLALPHTAHGPTRHRAPSRLPQLLLAVPREILDAARHLFGGQLR
jgi:hypothetical protein